MRGNESQQWIRQTRTSGDTEAVAVRLAGQLQGGEWIALYGALGSGKTTFVRGLVNGLAGSSPVISPTFLLVRIYLGRLRLIHVDAYRLEGLTPLEIQMQIGLQDLSDERSVVAVEWADRVSPLLPDERLDVYLEHTMDGRLLRFHPIGKRYHQIVAGLGEEFEG